MLLGEFVEMDRRISDMMFNFLLPDLCKMKCRHCVSSGEVLFFFFAFALILLKGKWDSLA